MDLAVGQAIAAAVKEFLGPVVKQVDRQLDRYFLPPGLTVSKRKNQTHELVGAIQIQLQKEGYTLDSDGIFGTATEAAVARFQASRGLDPDGVVGPDTLKALFGPTG